jgi:hypothetical protein
MPKRASCAMRGSRQPSARLVSTTISASSANAASASAAWGTSVCRSISPGKNWFNSPHISSCASGPSFARRRMERWKSPAPMVNSMS